MSALRLFFIEVKLKNCVCFITSKAKLKKNPQAAVPTFDDMSGLLGRASGLLSRQLPRTSLHRVPQPHSALRLLCSSGSSSSDGDGDGKDGDVTAKRGELTSADEPVEATVVVTSEAESSESSLMSIDPSNISALPPVLVFPFPTRPLFPGVYQPAEVTNDALAKALLTVKASQLPYIGVFLPKEGHEEVSGGVGDLDASDDGAEVAEVIAGGTGDGGGGGSGVGGGSEETAVSGAADGALAPPAPLLDVASLHEVGTLAQVTRLTQTPRGVQLLLLGHKRVRLGRPVQTSPVILARVEEARFPPAASPPPPRSPPPPSRHAKRRGGEKGEEGRERRGER